MTYIITLYSSKLVHAISRDNGYMRPDFCNCAQNRFDDAGRFHFGDSHLGSRHTENCSSQEIKLTARRLPLSWLCTIQVNIPTEFRHHSTPPVQQCSLHRMCLGCENTHESHFRILLKPQISYLIEHRKHHVSSDVISFTDCIFLKYSK